MNCVDVNFGGYADCAGLMEKMNGGALQEKGITWTDITILSLTTWRTAIASKTESSRTVIPLPIHGFENTTDDPEIVTTQLGKKIMGSKPVPSGTLYLDVSLCDYKSMHALEDNYYEFFPSSRDRDWETKP